MPKYESIRGEKSKFSEKVQNFTCILVLKYIVYMQNNLLYYHESYFKHLGLLLYLIYHIFQYKNS